MDTAWTKLKIPGFSAFNENTGIPVSNVLEKGSQHAVADALSRAPVTLPNTDGLLGEEVYAVRKMNLCLDATDAEYDGAYFQEIH